MKGSRAAFHPGVPAPRRLPDPGSRTRPPDPGLQTQASGPRPPDPGLRTQASGPRPPDSDSGLRTQAPRVQTQASRVQTQASRVQTQASRVQTQASRARPPEPGLQRFLCFREAGRLLVKRVYKLLESQVEAGPVYIQHPQNTLWAHLLWESEAEGSY